MTSSLEDIKSIDLEEWLTLATAPSPTKLKQGQTPNMENVWTDEKPGSIITSPGFLKVGQIPSGNPVSFCINYFKTSAGTQTFVVSDNSTVWTTVDFQNFTAIITGLSSSFQLRGAVIRDKLWLTNGSDSVRTFDGSTVTVLDGTGGTPTVPKCRYIVYHDERIWLYHVSSARSAVYFSSLTDSSGNIIAPDNGSAWDTTDNFLQISEGDADFGTGMFLYRGYLFFFKQYSIWRLTGYDEYSYSRVKTRASTGTRFNESLQELDSLVHLIGVDGIYVFDGDESVRISDIIDPATASQTAFGFNQLQQPNTNNQFYEVTETSDWNAGNVPTNLAIDNQAALVACDDSQADFQAGSGFTNVDTTLNPGFVQLAHTNSGVSGVEISFQAPAQLIPSNGFSTIGSGSMITDGNITNPCGFTSILNGAFPPNANSFQITLPTGYTITQIIIRKWTNLLGSRCAIVINGVIVTITSCNNGGVLAPDGSFVFLPPSSLVDFVINIIPTSGNVFSFQSISGGTLTNIDVYPTAFNTTGQFISKALDLGIVPNNFGTFNVSQVLNGEGTSYFIQTSADGVTWGGTAGVTPGVPIGETPRRYLRWGVNFTSDGLNTPVIDAAYLPSVYLSAIHNIGSTVLSWGPFESDYSLFGQTVNFYYRGATSSIGVSSASWNSIVPGGVLSFSTSFQFIQFKIEILSGGTTTLPIINSVTINWVIGSVGQPQTLQNVASVYWRNRYWLSAAGPGATSNNTILVRGKKTFQSPWMLKDWSILSFTRYFDSLYGGSSVDGSIYQLDSGYSKNGLSMDSYFETGDFVFGGFTAQLVELLVEVERTGPWNLNVGVSVDGGNTFDDYSIDLTSSTYDTNYMKRLNMDYMTTRFRLRFRTNGIDQPFQVHRCIAFYSLSGVRGSIRGDYM